MPQSKNQEFDEYNRDNLIMIFTTSNYPPSQAIITEITFRQCFVRRKKKKPEQKHFDDLRHHLAVNPTPLRRRKLIRSFTTVKSHNQLIKRFKLKACTQNAMKIEKKAKKNNKTIKPKCVLKEVPSLINCCGK